VLICLGYCEGFLLGARISKWQNGNTWVALCCHSVSTLWNFAGEHGCYAFVDTWGVVLLLDSDAMRTSI
jgi:hypothetical protein